MRSFSIKSMGFIKRPAERGPAGWPLINEEINPFFSVLALIVSEGESNLKNQKLSVQFQGFPLLRL
jgi:hypothetical protein